MGNTFEVEVWKQAEYGGEYRYFPFWRGESFLQAIRQLRDAKKLHGCVCLTWRKPVREATHD